MNRVLRIVAALVIPSVLIAACSSSNGRTTPLLGYPRASRSTGTQGWGTIQPVTIFNGGDPTGLVKDITWSTWGGTRAVGEGMGFQVPVNGPVAAGHFASAIVIAFDLGMCDKHWSYLRVRWYFPGHNPNLAEPRKFESTCNSYSSSKYI